MEAVMELRNPGIVGRWEDVLLRLDFESLKYFSRAERAFLGEFPMDLVDNILLDPQAGNLAGLNCQELRFTVGGKMWRLRTPDERTAREWYAKMRAFSEQAQETTMDFGYKDFSTPTRAGSQPPINMKGEPYDYQGRSVTPPRQKGRLTLLHDSHKKKLDRLKDRRIQEEDDEIRKFKEKGALGRAKTRGNPMASVDVMLQAQRLHGEHEKKTQRLKEKKDTWDKEESERISGEVKANRPTRASSEPRFTSKEAGDRLYNDAERRELWRQQARDAQAKEELTMVCIGTRGTSDGREGQQKCMDLYSDAKKFEDKVKAAREKKERDEKDKSQKELDSLNPKTKELVQKLAAEKSHRKWNESHIKVLHADHKNRQEKLDFKQKTDKANREESVAIPVSSREISKKFAPGALGFSLAAKQGMGLPKSPTVLQVQEGSQAEDVGVEEGMKILRIAGKPFSRDALNACVKGKEEYEITFAKALPQLIINGAPNKAHCVNGRYYCFGTANGKPRYRSFYGGHTFIMFNNGWTVQDDEGHHWYKHPEKEHAMPPEKGWLRSHATPEGKEVYDDDFEITEAAYNQKHTERLYNENSKKLKNLEKKRQDQEEKIKLEMTKKPVNEVKKAGDIGSITNWHKSPRFGDKVKKKDAQDSVQAQGQAQKSKKKVSHADLLLKAVELAIVLRSGDADESLLSKRMKGSKKTPMDSIVTAWKANDSRRNELVQSLEMVMKPLRARMKNLQVESGYPSLSSRPEMRLYQEHLVNDVEGWSHRLEPDPIRQVEDDLDSLLNTAAKAQEVLKQELAPNQTWSNGTIQRPAGVPSAMHAYDPGIKSKESAEIAALVKFGPGEGQQRHRHLLDLSRLMIVFSSCDMLQAGLDHILKRFEVVDVRNYFITPSRLGDQYIEVLIVVIIRDGREQVPHVCELRLEHRSLANKVDLTGFTRLLQEVYSKHADLDAVDCIARHAMSRSGESHRLRRFRQHLAKRFGSTICAWRKHLGDKRLLHFNRLREICFSMGCGEHVTELWQELDPSRGGSISMWELDPKAVAFLAMFRTLIYEKLAYGDDDLDGATIFQRLCAPIKPSQQGYLDLKEFRVVTKPLGLSQVQADYIFTCLDHAGSVHKPPAQIEAADIVWLKKLPTRVDLEAVACAQDAMTMKDPMSRVDSGDNDVDTTSRSKVQASPKKSALAQQGIDDSGLSSSGAGQSDGVLEDETEPEEDEDSEEEEDESVDDEDEEDEEDEDFPEQAAASETF